MTFKKFTELEVWRLSPSNATVIWNKLFTESFESDNALRNQISRSSGSVMDNIVEGFGRGGNKEFIQFLGIAEGPIPNSNHKCSGHSTGPI